MSGRWTISLVLLAGAAVACASNTAPQGVSPQASVSAMANGNETASYVWVCHGGKNPKWHRVSAHAAAAHHDHGDPVSSTPREKNERCTR